MPKKNKQKIGLVSNRAGKEAQTFVQLHANQLNLDYHFFGEFFPTKALINNNKIENINYNISSIISILKKLFLNKISKKNQAFELGRLVRTEFFISYLKKNNVKLLITEFGPTSVLCYPACKALNIPIIPFFHGYDVSVKEIISLFKKEYQSIFQYAPYVFVVSQHMKQTITELGCPTHKIIVNPCPPNNMFYDLTPNYNSQQIISIGRFVDKKAPYYTLYAFKLLLTHYPNAKLIYCGDGHLLDSCVNLANIWGISHAVQFKGRTSPDAIKQLIATSCMYVQHSIVAQNGDAEGTPVAILEAMAASLPIVSTKHRGIAETVVHNQNGFLVEEHDYQDMADKMKTLLDNPNLMKKMGQEGHILAKEKHSVQKHIQKIQTVINQLIN